MQNRRRVVLLVWAKVHRPILRISIGALFLALAPVTSAYDAGHGDSSVRPIDEIVREAMLTYLNEIDGRRRLTTIFDNEQSPFQGLQVGYTNISTGNLTFLLRDLIRVDRMPIVFGRVYDSRKDDESDFGPGWKLAPFEMIERDGPTLKYVDSSNASYELQVSRRNILSAHPHLTGITGGTMSGSEITLLRGDLKRVFRRSGPYFTLREVSDRHGNWIRFEYENGHMVQIRSSGGRYVAINREPSGRIASAEDDSGRIVTFSYDSRGRLSTSTGFGGSSWRYEYNAADQLRYVTDPRGIIVLRAEFEGQRVSRVGSQHTTYELTYFPGRTVIRNGFSQSTTFWIDSHGLVTAVQDGSGALSEIERDITLKVAGLKFEGQPVAALVYDEQDRLIEVRRYDAGPTVEYTAEYAGDDITSISQDNHVIGEYRYSDTRQVAYANDENGERSYTYDDLGLISGYSAGGVNVALVSDRFGRLRAIDRNSTRVADLKVDERDLVTSITYYYNDTPFSVSYEYGPIGFRTKATYSAYSGEWIDLDFAYDQVANLTGITFRRPSGAVYTDTYVIGEHNQLEMVLAQTGAEIDFEYDAVGRPVLIKQAGRVTNVTYDAVGRVQRMTVDDAELFEIEYGPMDRDAVEAADFHSGRTPIRQPVASNVFGSTVEIVFSRPVGSPFWPVIFDDTISRFIISDQPFSPPDALQQASLHRRAIPTDPDSGISIFPLGFDRPSNSLFLPPEFYSTNCYTCVGSVTAVDIEVQGSDEPTFTTVGNNVPFDVTADGVCFWLGLPEDPPDGPPPVNPPPLPPPALFRHLIQYGDGSGQVKYTESENTSFDRAYASSGVKVASDTVSCTCTIAPFAVDTGAHTVVVLDPVQEPVTVLLTFDDGPTSAGADNTRTVIKSLHQNDAQNNIRATFFIQTHVPNRLPAAGGRANVELAISHGHEIGIHTGSDGDHVRHTQRVILPPYNVTGSSAPDGQNALESDLIRAKIAIDNLNGGMVPSLVRAPFLDLGNAAILPTYQRQALTHVGIDIPGDDVPSPSYTTITAQLESKVAAELGAGNTNIIILLHDIRPNTANYLETSGTQKGYLKTIKDVIESEGPYVAVFDKL